jgi:pimeloyl-ACP methyl ester carboxylesterase
MPALRVDGIALDYDVRGGGAPIVLLHGFTSSYAGNWGRRGWIDLLADNGFRVVGLDFPSHGESGRVYDATRVTTDRLAAEVVAVLDHLDIERPDLFGFSMGGGVALKLAMDHADRVGRVVVSGVGDAALNRFHDPGQIADIRAAFEADSADQVDSPAAQAIRRCAEAGGTELKALIPFLRNGGWPGGLDGERPVATPVLMIVADHDQFMGEVTELARWLAHARVLCIAGCDHYTVLNDDRVRAAVLDFLRTTTDTRESAMQTG